MKINLKIQRNLKEIRISDIPVYEGSVATSFKRFDVNSENGTYDDAVLMLHITEADAKDLAVVSSVSIEKSFNETVVYKKDLSINTITGSYLFLNYPLKKRIVGVNSVTDYVSGSGVHYYEVLLEEKHGITLGDYDCNTNFSISILGDSLNELYKARDIFVNGETEQDDLRKVYINVPSIYAPEVGGFISLNSDPFIYNDLADYDGEWKFYGDNENCSEFTRIKFVYENSNINIPVGFSSDTEYIGLRQNELVDNFYKKLTKDIIPGFVNPEKIKFIPFMELPNEEDVNGREAVKLEFDLHFRKRAIQPYYDENGDAKYDVGAPTKSWSIETEETSEYSDKEHVSYWNSFPDFAFISENNDTYGDNMYTGDLVGLLGFTDDDILNRKKKVKQSFLRLSFYSSNNPLQTSMLFYSTVFLDANELYSKYIKLYTSQDYDNILDDYMISEDRGDSYNNGWGLVFFNGKPTDENKNTYSFSSSELLTATINITSENDHSSSAEGFNLYLFSDDAPKNDDEQYVIYMKIEFNHAGYGRTFPMILWPNDNGVPAPLTQDNYYDNLYIPVVIGKKNGKFYYYIERAKNDLERNTIKFALFEPKLEPRD